MTIIFNVTDKSTGQPLSGILVFCEYQQCWEIPIVDGRCEVASSGSFAGSKRQFTVWVEGYVPHSDFFFKHDGLTFNVPLAKYDWYQIPPSPEPLAQPNLLPLVALGGLALLAR